ncbi:Hsp20 family protein [Staphylococcus marylandisciuri]|nr:Hsp20 family protein [Staphylococcus marylandisciuri]
MEQKNRTDLSTELFNHLFPKTITADVHETDESYIVIAELPGLNKEDIDIKYEDNILTLNASHQESDDENATYHIKERHKTDMNRQFIFKNVNCNDITAQFNNGLLKVTLPKQESKTNISID